VSDAPAGRGPARWRWLLVLLSAAAAAVGVAALLVNIFQRQQEARSPFVRVVDLTETTDDPAVWGRNFPLQYDDYRRTVDQVRTRYGGSEALRQRPSQADPRSVVAQSRLDEDPRLRRLWAGYPFGTDFREERGHAYMLIDQRHTRRVLEFKQPGTCLNCHASTWTAMRKLGDGDLGRGFEAINRMSYAEATRLVQHPVACIDCHDPASMRLRITRPAFAAGIRAAKAAQGAADYDVNAQATAQEMRSYVCGQCHVEYYFAGPEKRLTFPWAKGLTADAALAHYDEVGFADWTHAEAGTRALKAQHPEFEMWSQGVHARSGVACADCHMPYKRVGGMKVSDHHVRSPLLNVNRACQGCHHFPEEELRQRVEAIQARFVAARDLAMNAVVDLIDELAATRRAGRPDAELAPARALHRRAQFLLDYVEAENSVGFHAPGEALRLLTQAVDAARRGQLALRPTAPPAGRGGPR
jgi:nitrite reductase (cytochrome c-552)